MRRYTYIADGKGMGGGRTVPIACCRRTGCLRVVIGYARKRAEVLKCSVLMCQQLPHAFCNCEKPENRVYTGRKKNYKSQKPGRSCAALLGGS